MDLPLVKISVFIHCRSFVFLDKEGNFLKHLKIDIFSVLFSPVAVISNICSCIIPGISKTLLVLNWDVKFIAFFFNK